MNEFKPEAQPAASERRLIKLCLESRDLLGRIGVRVLDAKDMNYRVQLTLVCQHCYKLWLG